MAFVDELSLDLAAGKGGNGVVRWRREKFIQKGGPAGGNGGRGGDVYLEAVTDLLILGRYKGQTGFSADNGSDGQGAKKSGADGRDFILKLPVGSFVRNQNNSQTYDLTEPGQRVLVLRGGRGGRGNFEFRGPTRTTPEFATDGKPGEQGTFVIELRLVVDVGFIGLPNAGKSSLLNELTAAHAKVGAYPFTTLEPNLGMLDDVVLADIPGLIEGAARGKGLGMKFLRHVERTRVLAHCISLEHPDPTATYDIVRNEIAAYGRGLAEKPEMIILTKTDLSDSATIERAQQALRQTGREVLTCSIHDLESLRRLGRRCAELARTNAVGTNQNHFPSDQV